VVAIHAVIKDQDLFRPGPPAQYQQRLYLSERRIGGEVEVVQQPSLLDKARTPFRREAGNHHGQRQARGAPSRRPSRPSRDHANQSAAQVLRRVAEKDLAIRRARGRRLHGLSGEFKKLDGVEADRLAAAHAAILKERLYESHARRTVFVRHDIKVDAATFGFPSAAPPLRACAGHRSTRGS